MDILVISEVTPSEKSGGPVILKRHFDQCKDIKFTVFSTDDLVEKIFFYPFFKRLEQSRIRKVVLAFRPLYEILLYSFRDKRIDSLHGYDAVLTIAHGRECFFAKSIAKRLHVPLITIFHDWYPVSSGAHLKMQFLLKREFKNLYKSSKLAFCVSEQMREKLGAHANSHILFPISASNSSNEVDVDFEVKKIFYAGFCGGSYSKQLKRLAEVIKDNDSYSFHVSGNESEKLNETFGNYSNIEVRNFVPEEDFQQYLETADILLIVLDFDSRKSIHYATHFPSKIVEYVQLQKIIVVWGPEYSTAVQWAVSTGAALPVCDPDPIELLKRLDDFAVDKEGIKNMLEKVKTVATGTFDRNEIQRRFEETILLTISHK